MKFYIFFFFVSQVKAFRVFYKKAHGEYWRQKVLMTRLRCCRQKSLYYAFNCNQNRGVLNKVSVGLFIKLEKCDYSKMCVKEE